MFAGKRFWPAVPCVAWLSLQLGSFFAFCSGQQGRAMPLELAIRSIHLCPLQ